MEMLKSKTKKVKYRLKAWLGCFIHRTATGQLDRNAVIARLKSTVGEAFAPDCIKALGDTLYQEIGDKKADFTRLRATSPDPDRIRTLISDLSNYPPMSSDNGDISLTLGDFINRWSEFTGQDEEELKRILNTSIVTLINSWHLKDDFIGFTNQWLHQNPQHAQELICLLSMVLIKTTLQDKLLQAIGGKLEHISSADDGEIADGMNNILHDASTLATLTTEKKIAAWLDNDPQAKEALVDPEVAALAEYEEYQQEWGGDVNTAADLLLQSLKPDLQSTAEHKQRPASHATLRAIGRRNLLRNIGDAIKGRLHGSLIDKLFQWFKRSAPAITMIWESPNDTSKTTNTTSILGWLFRRHDE